LPEAWKEMITVPISIPKDNKTDCGNYRGITPNILLARLTPYAEVIIGDHQCRFQCNRSTTDHINCTYQILEKKWEYDEAGHQLFTNFTKAYDSVRREACIIFSVSLVSP